MPRGFGNNFFPGLPGLLPVLLLPLLFNNNRGNTNIININTRRRNRRDFC